jgi:uncharacterized protein (TIGR03084 family)
MDATLLADLADEHSVLDALLAGMPAADWARQTPAKGWTIADSVRHLAVSEQAAVASVREGRDPFDGLVSVAQGPSDGPAVRAWWAEACRRSLDALASCADSVRVPWGGRRMAARSLATARLMECWAHGLDCFAALDRTPVDTDRLRHVSWLGWMSLPYAFDLAGEEPPLPPRLLRLELDSPSGAGWQFGPASSPAVITGPAGDWCRVATHRLRPPAVSALRSEGPLAEATLRVARAYL